MMMDNDFAFACVTQAVDGQGESPDTVIDRVEELVNIVFHVGGASHAGTWQWQVLFPGQPPERVAVPFCNRTFSYLPGTVSVRAEVPTCCHCKSWWAKER